MRSACRSTSAVTNGLPSRSPPIQLPMRRNDGSSTVLQAGSGGRQLVLERRIEARQLAQKRES